MITFKLTCIKWSPLLSGCGHFFRGANEWWANNVGSCCARVGSGVQTGATTPNIVGHVGSCCVRVGSGVQTDTATPNIGGPTMLEVVVSVLVVVCKLVQQLPTLVGQQCWESLCPCWWWCANGCSNSQQYAATSNRVCRRTQHGKIQQCWELLANNVASVCRGVLVVSYSYFSFDAIRSRNTIKSIKFCRVIDISPYYLHFFFIKAPRVVKPV